MGAGSEVGAEAIILGPAAIGAHCRVEQGVVINECVVLDNVRINAGGLSAPLRHRRRRQHRQSDQSARKGGDADPGGAARASHRVPAGDGPAPAGDVAGPREWQTDAKPVYQKVKRGLDVLLAGLGLILTAPLLGLVALLIKLDSPGGIIFRQERCGQGGRNFTMYKFRSMVDNSEDLKRELQDLNEVDGPMFKISRDPRITRLGKSSGTPTWMSCPNWSMS